MYVFLGVVFFGVMTVTGGGPVRFVASTEGGIVFGTGSETGATVGTEADPSGTEEASGFVGWWIEGTERAARDPADFNAAAIEALSYAHFLVLPLFALLLKPFWRRRYYVEHLVFGLHFHAFGLLIGAIVVGVCALAGVGPEDPRSAWVLGGLNLVLAVYLYVALLRFYRGRWWTTALKQAGVGFAYLLVSMLVIGIVAIVAMLRF